MPRPTVPLVPIFRFRNDDNSANHSWSTTSTAPDGWTSEGVAFYVLSSPLPGTVPLYRYLFLGGAPWQKLGTSSVAPLGYGSPTLVGYVLPVSVGPLPGGYVTLTEYVWDSNAGNCFYTTNPSLEILTEYTQVGPVCAVWQAVDVAIRGVLQPSAVGGAVVVRSGGTVLASQAWGQIQDSQGNWTPMTAQTPMLLGVASWGVTAAAVLQACQDFPDAISLDTTWWTAVDGPTTFPNLNPSDNVKALTLRQLLQCVGTPIDNQSLWGEEDKDDKLAYLKTVLDPMQNPNLAWAPAGQHAPSAFCFAALAAAVEVVAAGRGNTNYRDYVQNRVMPALGLASNDFVPAGSGQFKGYASSNVGLSWPPNGMPLYVSMFGWSASADACARFLEALRASPTMAPLFQGDGTPGNPGLGWFTNALDNRPSVGCNHSYTANGLPYPGFVAVMYHFPDTDVVVLTNTNARAAGILPPLSTVNDVIRMAYDGS